MSGRPRSLFTLLFKLFNLFNSDAVSSNGFQLTGPICLSTSNAFGNERQGPAVCALGRRPEWNVTVRSRTGFGTLTFLFSFLFCRFYLKSGTPRRKCGGRFECWLTSAASQRNFYSYFLWFAPNFFFNEEREREKKRGQVEFNYYGLLKVWIKRVHTSRRWNCAHERTRRWRHCLTLSSFTSNLSNKSNCVDAAKGEMTWHFRFHLFRRPPFNRKNPIKNDIFLNVWNVFKFLLSSTAGNWRERIVYRHPILRRLSWFPAISNPIWFRWWWQQQLICKLPKKNAISKVEKSVPPPFFLADNCVVKKTCAKR